MSRFRYAADPLCFLATAAYLFNRLVLKPRLPGAFLHGQFNDLLLVPAALPWVLWLHRRLRRRRAQAIHRAMYLFLKYAAGLEAVRLTPPDAALSAAGFRLLGRAGFCQGLVHSDVWRRAGKMEGGDERARKRAGGRSDVARAKPNSSAQLHESG